MAEDQPGPSGRGDRDDRPTRPLATPSGPTAPLPGDRYTPPPATPPAGGPPPEALGGFWRRLGGAFIDWLLVGILAGAIGALFGVDTSVSPA
jgi:predicted lipid-binding transport protein (Tim44 family)